MDDANAHLGRQKGGRVTDTFHACVLHPEQQAESFQLHKCLKLQHLTDATRKGFQLGLGPLPPPSVYLGRLWHHSCDKMGQAL